MSLNAYFSIKFLSNFPKNSTKMTLRLKWLRKKFSFSKKACKRVYFLPKKNSVSTKKSTFSDKSAHSPPAPQPNPDLATGLVGTYLCDIDMKISYPVSYPPNIGQILTYNQASSYQYGKYMLQTKFKYIW